MASITNQSVALPVDYARELIEETIKESVALKLGTRLPDMSTRTRVINVADTLPMAYFQNTTGAHAVSEDTTGSINKKRLSNAKWAGKTITAEEIAVIIPVAINTIRDAQDGGLDLVGSLQRQVVSAFHDVIDSAVFFGTGKPATAPDAILTQATAKSNTVEWASTDSLYDVVSEAMGKVEESGYVPNAIVGGPKLKGYFRQLLDKEGRLLIGGEVVDLPRYSIMNGAWDEATAHFIVGDFSQLVYAFRNDMEYKVLEEATLYDPATGSVLYNLAQQDMVAFRFTMRLGWQIPNPVTRVGGENSFPFAAIVPDSEE